MNVLNSLSQRFYYRVIRRFRGQPVYDVWNEKDKDNKYWKNYKGGSTSSLTPDYKWQEVAVFVEDQLKDARVLDIGCGYGRMNLFFDIREYIGTDPSTDMIRGARQLNKHKFNCIFLFQQSNTFHRLSEASFDIITASTVMLHLKVKTVEKYADEILRLLKPNGFFLANFPKKNNINIPKVFSKYLIGVLDTNWLDTDIVYLFRKSLN